MKIAITSKGPALDSEVDASFGRAAYILIVDTFSQSFQAIDNKENADALRGAGIQAASLVSESGARALLTGVCGPKAYQTLLAAGVKVASRIEGTVKDALTAFNEGRVQFSDLNDLALPGGGNG